MKNLLFLVAALGCVAADYSAPAGDRPANAKPEDTVLPGGRLLTPLGKHYMTGSGTFGIAVNDDASVVATADGGPNGFSVTFIRNGTAERVRTKGRVESVGEGPDEDDWKSVFMGLAFGADGELYASEGNSGRVRIVGKKGSAIDTNIGEFKDSYTGDLALDRNRGLLYVLDQANFRVVTIDVRQRKVVASTKVGRVPFAMALSPDRNRLYVTNIGMFEYKFLKGEPIPFPLFGFPSRESKAALGDPNVQESNSLCVLDVSASPRVITFIPTGLPFGRNTHGGSSPSGVAANGESIFVSNGHNDSITVVNAKTLKRERDIPIRLPGLEGYRGVLPIGLTIMGKRLLVAEAGINAVGVIEDGKVTGHIPAAWFPTRVAVHNDTIYVASAKGFGTGPNANLKESFQADLRKGAVTVVPFPSDLGAQTDRVLANNGFRPAQQTAGKLPEQLRNVVIIVKENRTYDELFGVGARFGVKVTPNHHEMARRWSSGANFYADSEVSVDGHHWLVGSYPDAWTESSLMASYGGQKNFRTSTTAPGRLLFAESNSSVHPEEQPENGTLWHHLERNKISFRNFGEGFELAGVDEGEGLKPTGARFQTNIPMPDPLFRNTSRTYAQYNNNIPDQYRASQLIAELKTMKELPRLIFVHLPNDHTAKPRPQDGYPTIASYVADNDYALGRIMEYLTRRPEWKQTAVFVTEDDAQGGVDSVDSHRTVLLVASPYARPGYLSRRHSSFPGMLKTAFRILRIPPLNLYDAVASDLSDSFSEKPDLKPYDLQPADLSVFDPARAKEPKDPLPSERMDDPNVLRRQHRK